jgi:hypothetical protein
MTFSSAHYVPVLKVKRGEKAAIGAIDPRLRSWVTPLLEIVQFNRESKKTLEKHLDTAFNGLAANVQGYARCFLDTRELAPEGAEAATAVFRRASTEGLVFTPVTGISRPHDVEATLRHRTHGLAIRLTVEELKAGRIGLRLMAFLGDHQLSPGEVDLIVDLGVLSTMVAEGVSALTEHFLAGIPNHSGWRTLTVSGCGFPKSMAGVQRLDLAQIERVEWTAWRDYLYLNRHNLNRLPTFSDCGIQNSEGVEGFDPVKMKASAAVRYALPDDWLLIKGESTKVRLAKEQFPDLARRLVYEDLRHHFAGPGHCSGCAGMQQAADGLPKLGSPEAWRRLGTIHHITRAVEGLAALSWP